MIVLLSAALVTAQQARGTLRGLITDELGAAIVGANVTLTDASGVQKKTTTNGEGVYNFAGLALGKYTLTAAAPGFAPSENREVNLTTARQTVDLTLRVTIEEKVTIAETAVSTEATNNANQTVIAGKDLDALPDDLDELAAALRRLPVPLLDQTAGRSSSTVSPAATFHRRIRSAIRINQNPFAAENDQPSARIDILTRPGTDKFRGGASMNFNDESLNSAIPVCRQFQQAHAISDSAVRHESEWSTREEEGFVLLQLRTR